MNHFIKNSLKRKEIFHNLSQKNLRIHEIENNYGNIVKTKYGDVFAVDTGKYTGRSPNDKFIVKDNDNKNKIWWGNVNKPVSKDVFNELKNKVLNHFDSLDNFYMFDGYCGSSNKSRKHVRFLHEMAWQQHFVSNMFINANEESSLKLKNSEPDFTIVNACSLLNHDWKRHNLNSEIGIIFDIKEKLGIIIGTWYGGENKKGIFSLMNYWLPEENILPMHCAANISPEGNTCLFFGLSGTGKTSLSVDPNRYLIGDDEHGWDSDGIFNFEGGCYAKTINLNEDNEPDIYRAIKPGALLENVWLNSNRSPDYNNVKKTQNGRVSYPIEHISNWHKSQLGNHPDNIIFLTCDAYGVLPLVSVLDHDQAMYYFLQGYTSKIAGTERGIIEPEATFSPCFGGAFLTRHPQEYAKLLKKKLEQHKSNVYLVNTGWIGGSYGIGERINIKLTRKCIEAIHNGSIQKSRIEKHYIFDLNYAIDIGDISTIITNPVKTWNNLKDYNNTANKLKYLFDKNYATI